MKFFLPLFIIVYLSRANSANCELAENSIIKYYCFKTIKIESVSIEHREKILKNIKYYTNALIELDDYAKFNVQHAFIFLYQNKQTITNDEIKYFKILAATYLLQEGENYKKILNVNQDISDELTVELSLPPMSFGYLKIKKLLPTTQTIAFRNNRNNKIYVLKNFKTLRPKLFFYDNGVLKESMDYCRDKNIFLGKAHKNKKYDKYEICFRYNGPRLLNASADQICFDHLDLSDTQPFSTGAGYDSYDKVGVARGFDNSKYYCNYNFKELFVHGFTDLIPYYFN